MFIDALLLDCVAYGFAGGGEWVTLVNTQRSGRESRDSKRSRAKHYYVAPFENLDAAHRHLVVAAHNACLGRGHSFRFFDRMDYLLDDQVIGVADGTADQTLQLVKTYQFGSVEHGRIIEKPVDHAVDYGRGEKVLGPAPAYVVTADADGSSARTPISFTLDYDTGIVTFTATTGHIVRATGWFDVPVRFDMDKLMFTVGDKNAHTSDVELVEVWDEDAS